MHGHSQKSEAKWALCGHCSSVCPNSLSGKSTAVTGLSILRMEDGNRLRYSESICTPISISLII